MSKKRLLMLTVLGIFVFYLISCFAVYSLSKEVSASHFREIVHNEYDSMEKDIEISDDLSNLKYHLYTYSPNYPTVFALQDSDGNLIARTTPVILVDYSDENEKYIESFIIELDKYLTDEIKQQISDYIKIDYGNAFWAKSLSVCKDGDEYIPVKAEFYDELTDYNFTIEFSNKKPDFTIERKYGCNIFFYGFKNINNKAYETQCEKLYKNLESHIKNFNKTHRNADYNSGGGFEESGHHQFEIHFENISGQKFCFYFESEYNMIYAALTSDVFKYSIQSISITFFIVALAVMIVISKLYDKNQRINKSREIFVAAAAHELKTPLAVIANKSECILEDVSPELNKEYVNSIYDESKRMSRMVKTLLQYNKLSSDRKIEKSKESLKDIIDEQACKYQPLFEAKNITYSQSLDETLILKCNKELIGLVIDNFLSNAVKFTPSGGEIKITARKLMDKTGVEVFNSGSSISKEDAPHIWEELYSGDKSRTRNGDSTGMGLAICRLILGLHKFDYGFRNVTDGVYFWFCEK